ncbi:MAG TPA: heme o synthase [Terriglobia bacterium]|nr:heme o synthase [Terriglobia bacterium]
MSVTRISDAAGAVTARLKDYWTLTKPEVNFLVLVSTWVGFDLGWHGPFRLLPLVHTLLGTLLVASGTATLNQYLERDFDARMRRTSQRPLPAGRLRSFEALALGLLLSLAGAAYLALAVNALTSLLAVATLVSYLALYTPLKRRSAWCMFVGAFPGAIPPLIGWAAARGSLSFEPVVLSAVVFLWQFPHFLSIAWMYREDYVRAGYCMLPANDAGGRSMAWQIVVSSLLLVPVSLSPALFGRAGTLYFLGALLLGAAYTSYGFRLAASRSRVLARRVLLASVVYLPLIFGLMMLDKKGAA